MTPKNEILDIIKQHCLNCVSGDLDEVRNCASEGTCVLYPYRLGKDPNPSSAKVKIGKHFAQSNTKNKR